MKVSETIMDKPRLICSSCLAEVETLYQFGTCRKCLQESFKRLRPLFIFKGRK